MNQESKTFEASIRRLEEIVRLLEKGDAPLEESLTLFEEGTGLVKTCGGLLDRAELKIVTLSKGEDGAPVETEYRDAE